MAPMTQWVSARVGGSVHPSNGHLKGDPCKYTTAAIKGPTPPRNSLQSVSQMLDSRIVSDPKWRGRDGGKSLYKSSFPLSLSFKSQQQSQESKLNLKSKCEFYVRNETSQRHQWILWWTSRSFIYPERGRKKIKEGVIQGQYKKLDTDSDWRWIGLHRYATAHEFEFSRKRNEIIW